MATLPTALYVLPEQGLLASPTLRRELAPARLLLCPAADAVEAAAVLPDCRLVPFHGPALTPALDGLPDLRALLPPLGQGTTVLLRDPDRSHGWEPYRTALRILGARRLVERGAGEDVSLTLDAPRRPRAGDTMLLKACGGIGNVVQATCILSAAMRQGMEAVFCPVSDGGGPGLASLFADSGRPGLAVVAPGDLPGVKADLVLNIEARGLIDPGDFFHSPYREPMDRNECRAYAAFFANVTGLAADPSETFVGGLGEDIPDRLKGRVVVCPGSKPGWDSKRWPHMGRLLDLLEDPVVLCRQADLDAYASLPHLSPIRGNRAETVTDYSLPRAAALLRSARAVVANDCGMAHVAAAAGAPTLVLFGPSSLVKNLHPRPNVQAMHLDLECMPCQGRSSGPGRLSGRECRCDLGFRCLADIAAGAVAERVKAMTGARRTDAKQPAS